MNLTNLVWFSFSSGISMRTLFRATMPTNSRETPTWEDEIKQLIIPSHDDLWVKRPICPWLHNSTTHPCIILSSLQLSIRLLSLSFHPSIHPPTVLTVTLRPSGARTNHLRASMSYSPMKHTPLIPSPSILFRANRATVRAPGSPQAMAWKRRAFFSMASLPHLGTAARNQVIVSMTHHTLPAMVKKYRTMKNSVHTWERWEFISHGLTHQLNSLNYTNEEVKYLVKSLTIGNRQ